MQVIIEASARRPSPLPPLPTGQGRRGGFTLIELLVVIAIISILAAALMPALPAATDRSRVTECRSNLAQVAIALRMYYNDQGSYPDSLQQLARAGFITDDSVLLCTKTGAVYYYERPTPETPVNRTIAACVDPRTPAGKRPHSYRNSLLTLQKGGKMVEVGR